MPVRTNQRYYLVEPIKKFLIKRINRSVRISCLIEIHPYLNQISCTFFGYWSKAFRVQSLNSFDLMSCMHTRTQTYRMINCCKQSEWKKESNGRAAGIMQITNVYSISYHLDCSTYKQFQRTTVQSRVRINFDWMQRRKKNEQKNVNCHLPIIWFTIIARQTNQWSLYWGDCIVQIFLRYL